MNAAAIEAFDKYFGDPSGLAVVIGSMLMLGLGIALIKATMNGVKELQDEEKTDFHYQDWFLAMLRVAIVMAIVTIFFGF